MKGKKRGVKKGRPGASKVQGGCPHCDRGPFRRLNQHISMCHKPNYVTRKRPDNIVEEILLVNEPKPVAPASVEITLFSCSYCPYVTISELEIDRHLGERHWVEHLEKYHADWLVNSKKVVTGHMFLEAK